VKFLHKHLVNFYVFFASNRYSLIISVHTEGVFFLSILEKFSDNSDYRPITAMLTADICLGEWRGVGEIYFPLIF